MRKDAETDVAIRVVGMMGRMISWSKSEYLRSHPNNVVVFNANVCADPGKIWFGDLDITRDSEKLQQLADELDQMVYVLHEMDGRFENETQPLIDQAVATFKPARVRTEA